MNRIKAKLSDLLFRLSYSIKAEIGQKEGLKISILFYSKIPVEITCDLSDISSKIETIDCKEIVIKEFSDYHTEHIVIPLGDDFLLRNLRSEQFCFTIPIKYKTKNSKTYKKKVVLINRLNLLFIHYDMASKIQEKYRDLKYDETEFENLLTSISQAEDQIESNLMNLSDKQYQQWFNLVQSHFELIKTKRTINNKIEFILS